MMEAVQTEQVPPDDVHLECDEPGINNDDLDIKGVENVVVPDPIKDEDNRDPFFLDAVDPDDHNFADVPPHIITIYVLVSWLHLQFHL